MSDASASRILVVEDDLHLAEGMAENMRAEGYSADTAHDGQRGLEMAIAGDYDLLVLDVMLPQMDGFAVCRALRQQGKSTPVLFLTARGDLVDVVTQAIKEVTGVDTELSTTGGTSDGRFIADICPQVIEFGPTNATIHKVNECLPVAEIEPLQQVYRRVLELLLLKR